MNSLAYSLRQLCDRNRDGSHATQGDRQGCLQLMARQLKEAGFRQLKATSLNGKHVDALLGRWRNDGLSAGTIKNRMAHLRWWAEKVGRKGLIASSNVQLEIPKRVFVTNVSKAAEVQDKLGRVSDPYVRASLELQRVFGLRREESIKFQPRYADQGDHLRIKGSWTKGGRERVIPIITPEQRAALDFAHKLVGERSLIPAEKTYIEQRHVYDRQCKLAELKRMHGLRHAYAQLRYEALTGWKPPAAGGPSTQSLTVSQRLADFEARLIISRELGHERIEITKVYLGS
ncbi:phage integrase N-terminal domain-containing protein [Steroidobacter agaridevorans]|uniref:phage integrase N-terminal domain-containing protein n=2 Tax=Steroidobacter agaridevorans TaxID=2695856 RepID=UPI00132C0B4A|nr:phage integrase N-terminal domain-containing protein [Steroidobacter agaridevorans]GFE86887.1 integrase [Steroidobacter agaridevorans]